MKKIIFTLLALFLLIAFNNANAQYSQKDSALVRTTFLREFDKNIIANYLHSNNSDSVNAALLSISHSEDTTFVDSIIKLNYNKYVDYIAFTLGQLGQSKKSEDYLLDSAYVPFRNNFIEAFGKCGDSLTLDFLIRTIDSSSTNHYSIVNSDILPLVISNFYSRGITNAHSLKYLIDNLKKIAFDNTYLSHRYNDTLIADIFNDSKALNTTYALYRLGSSKDAIPFLTKLIYHSKNNQTKLYVLGNFRKLKIFPKDIQLLKKLIASDSWMIRTETASSACYFPFKEKEEVALYLTLLNDKNPNVSRTVATTLKNIKYPKEKAWLKNKLEIILLSDSLTKNTKGELLISYSALLKPNVEDLIDDYSEVVEPKFIYRLLASNYSDWEFNFDYLSDRIKESNEIELLDLLPAYIVLQRKYINDKKYITELFTILQSNKPSSVSIIADGLKLPIIHSYREVLQEIILEQLFKNKNNPQFAESIISLAKLSYKIDRVFYDSVIDILSTSQLYSVKKYALKKQGMELTPPKNDKLFIKLWSKTFTYKFAKIETNRGSFTIKLKPEYAPMTCASFVSLAENSFYNGVTFHRVVPNFVIQTGDATNTGWGGPGYEIVSEFSPLPFSRAAVGVASIGKDTEGSQWFVMHSLFPHLNGRYTNWATVVNGMDVVDIIDEGDIIVKVTLIK